MPVCELCGNSNFVKEAGMFVCQDCGTKYTLEEARKLAEPDAPAVASASSASEAPASPISAIGNVASGVAAVALAALAQALNSAADFNPGAAGSEKDALAINNYICQGWQMVVDEYKKLEHPVKKDLDEAVAKAKESLIALDNAARLEPEKYVQNSLIYGNCIEIVDAAEDLNCYEQKEGEWKRVSFPVKSGDLKIPGQKDSWQKLRDAHRERIEQEYLDMHESEVALLAELRAEADKINAKLAQLKDEKKSKGFFNFAEKKEVKERMAPFKEELSEVKSKIRAVEREIENYVEDRLDELGKSFIRLRF